MSTPYVLTKHRPRGAALWEFEQTFQCEIEAAAVMRSNAGAGFAAKVSDNVVEVSVCVGRDDQTRHVERRSSILAFRLRRRPAPPATPAVPLAARRSCNQHTNAVTQGEL
jgi:hypothetical protein